MTDTARKQANTLRRKAEPDRQIVVSGNWAIATDGTQWILQRHYGGRWRSISFVRSTRDVLARCMREKGVAPEIAATLLSELPDRFPDGAEIQINRGSVRPNDPVVSRHTPDINIAPAKVGGES